MPGLAARTEPDLVDSEMNRHFAYSFVHEHEHLGATHLNYTAVVPPHVHFLDENPLVEDLSCTSKQLTFHLSPGAAGSGVQVGDIVVASSAYGCHTDEASGREHGRHLHADKSGGHSIIRRVASLARGPSGDVVAATSPADHADCFKASDIAFRWAPPYHLQDHPKVVAEKRYQLYLDAQRDEEDRRLLNLDSLLSACARNTSISWLGDADLKCHLDVMDFFDFYADMLYVQPLPLKGNP